MKRIPDIIKQAARDLRKNQTQAEKLLWNELKDRRLGTKFQRQFCMYLFTDNSGLDRYIIPDFYCSEQRLVVEVDGKIHKEKSIYLLDKTKEELLEKKGIRVIRIDNEDITTDIMKVVDKIAASFSGKEREFKGELGQTKRFKMINDSFSCENCKREIPKHPSGSARNHCPHCLYSKHLDKDFPGDRASTCHELMKPVGKDYHKNKGWMVIHECTKCGKKIPNKLAEDDDVGVFGKL